MQVFKVLVASLMVFMQAVACTEHASIVAPVPVQLQSLQTIQFHSISLPDSQQVAQLRKSMHFLQSVYCCSTGDLSYWFASRARENDRGIARMLKASANDRLDNAAVADLRAAIALLEKTANNERMIVNQEEREQLRCLLVKNKNFVPHAKKALGILSVANWLWKQASKVFLRESELAASTKDLLKAFPANDLAAMIGSPTLKKIISSIASTGNFAEFFIAWNSLDAFVSNSDQEFLSVFSADFNASIDANAAINVILSDFASLAAVLMHCTIQCFPQGQLAKKALTLEQLLSVYEKISALPIIEAFIALSALSTQITSIIDGLKQQDGSPDFSQWLKNNWVVLPIMAGVVAIRVAQYFLKPEGSPVDATS